MAIETQERKPVGKHHNMVRLNIWIMAAQDKQLDALCVVTGKSKSDAIRDAIQIELNSLRSAGVIE